MRWAAAVGLVIAFGCGASQDTQAQRRQAGCLSVRGCPATPGLQTCDARDPVASLATGIDGEVVAVRGQLELGELTCTLVACPGHCCNTCRGGLVLLAGGERYALRGAGLRANGDESLVCPSTGARGQQVLVQGTLHRRRNGRFEIDGARLCALPQG